MAGMVAIPPLHRLAGWVLSRWVVFAIYGLLGIAAPLLKFLEGNHNNIRIFFASPGHLLDQTNLYAAYPEEYFDFFLYGPVFCLYALPFSLVPEWMGVILYSAASTALFVGAIYSLDLTRRQRAGFCLICAVDFLTNQQNFQTNALIAACLIFGFSLLRRDRVVASALFVAFAIMFKVYGIAGLGLLLFTRRKGVFLGSILGWCLLFFLAPAALSSMEFVVASYGQWFERLGAENATNLGIVRGFGYQSVFDFFRRSLGLELPQVPVLLCAAAICGIPLLREATWGRGSAMPFLFMALILVSIVLFSTGSENPTYVILQAGVGFWFLHRVTRSRWLAWSGLGMAILFSSLAPTDLYYGSFGEFYNQKTLRVLPGLVIWIAVVAEMWMIAFFGREPHVGAPQSEMEAENP